MTTPRTKPLTYADLRVGDEVDQTGGAWLRVTGRTVSPGGGITFTLVNDATGHGEVLGGPASTPVLARRGTR